MTPMIWLGIFVYFVGCVLLIQTIDKEEYTPMYPLFFPVFYLVLYKTKLPAWAKIIVAILGTILTIGTVVVVCVVSILFLLMMMVSEMITDIIDLFDSKN